MSKSAQRTLYQAFDIHKTILVRNFLTMKYCLSMYKPVNIFKGAESAEWLKSHTQEHAGLLQQMETLTDIVLTKPYSDSQIIEMTTLIEKSQLWLIKHWLHDSFDTFPPLVMEVVRNRFVKDCDSKDSE